MAVAKRKPAGDARPVSELAALVRAENDRGTSYERMAAQARRHNFVISGSYFHQIAQGRVRHPGGAKLPAIAAGLGLTETQVREAVARDTGVHVEHNIDYRTSRLLNAVAELDRSTRDLWFQLSQAIASTLAAKENTTADGQGLDQFSQRRIDSEMTEMRENFKQQRGRERRQNES